MRHPALPCFVLVLVTACHTATPRPAPLGDGPRQAGAKGELEPCIIERIVDGDTAEVKVNGANARVRLLALDTEESWPGSSKPVTGFGVETSKWAKAFMSPGEPCFLELGGERRDVYDRWLAYLWRQHDGGWRMYNLEAIERGYSPYYTKYGFSAEHHAALAAAQAGAQAKQLGIWDPDNAPHLRGAYLGEAGLIALWDGRAEALAAFAASRASHPEIIELRTQYDALAARMGERVTVFTAVRTQKSEEGAWVGKCEGKPKEPFEVVASSSDAALVAALDGALERYRYYTGTLERRGKTLRLVLAGVTDVREAP